MSELSQTLLGTLNLTKLVTTFNRINFGPDWQRSAAPPMNIVESLWTASRLAVSDRIINKLRKDKPLDEADLKYLKDWFCSEYAKSSEKMDSGKIFFLLANTDNFTYLGTLEDKLWKSEELSKEDLEFILNSVVDFRSDLISKAC